MTNEQVAGIIRTLVAAVAGYFAGKGYIETSMVEAIAGAMATLGVAAWSVASKKRD